MEARLVVRGSFGLHLLYGILEDLFVAHVGLDQVFKAGNHSLSFLVKLNHRWRNIWEVLIYGAFGTETLRYERRSLVDTYSGDVDVVIVRQRVQHLHHWCFYQLQREPTDTATPGKTKICMSQQDFALFTVWNCRRASSALNRTWQLGNTLCSKSFYKLCIPVPSCYCAVYPACIPQSAFIPVVRWCWKSMMSF